MKVTQSHPTLCDPMDYTVYGILQARIQQWVAFPFARGSSQPRSPTLQADSLPAEPQGKPEKTGVGSLSLLQQIFLTHESTRGLLHCRRILYQLSYQGNPLELEGRDPKDHFTFMSFCLFGVGQAVFPGGPSRKTGASPPWDQ